MKTYQYKTMQQWPFAAYIAHRVCRTDLDRPPQLSDIVWLSVVYMLAMGPLYIPFFAFAIFLGFSLLCQAESWCKWQAITATILQFAGTLVHKAWQAAMAAVFRFFRDQMISLTSRTVIAQVCLLISLHGVVNPNITPQTFHTLL